MVETRGTCRGKGAGEGSEIPPEDRRRKSVGPRSRTRGVESGEFISRRTTGP